MAENESTRSSAETTSRHREFQSLRSSGLKPSEFLRISYSIDKASGLRPGKRMNSFRASTSANLKSIVQAVVKKIKFSTRYKYEILFYNPTLNKWQRFKEKIPYEFGTQLKFRVCRHKITVNRPQIENNTSSSTGNLEQYPTQVGVAPNMQQFVMQQGFAPVSPAFVAMYMMYLNFYNLQRMQNMM